MGASATCSTSSLGNCNVVLGHQAARSLTGNENVIIGKDANWSGNSTGGCNVIIGKAAGYVNCGTANVFMGHYAGGGNTSGDYNIFLGRKAGNTNTSGCCNIAIGCDVELPSATADNQFAIGSGTNRWITGDSSYNVTVNHINATKFCGDGSCLTNIAGFSEDADHNLFAGKCAGGTYDPSTGSAMYNVVLGYYAGQKIPDGSGDNNVFLGTYAGRCNSDGYQNVFIGRCAGFGQNAVTGQNNNAIGCRAGYTLTSGRYN